MLSRCGALVRVRLLGYVKSHRVLLPLIAALALLFFAHAGGPAPPGQAYGFAAALLFGVFAWQTKLVLDCEPDEQRRLGRLGVGSAPAEVLAGLFAAALAAVPIVVLSLLVPLLTRAVVVSGVPWFELSGGVWLHLLAVLGGSAAGALTSRSILPSPAWSTLFLLTTAVLVLVLGARDTAGVGWLVPRLFAGIRAIEERDAMTGLVVTAHALAWTAIVSTGYLLLRRGRA